MMNETVQYERTEVVMPDFVELKKLMEDCSQGQVREQGITKIQEIDSRQDKRDAVLRKRILQGSLLSDRRAIIKTKIDLPLEALTEVTHA